MPPSLRRTAAYATHAFILLSAIDAVNAATYSYIGCYSSSTPLTDQGSYEYQTTGYCQGVCEKGGYTVYAVSDGAYCYCGDELPATSTNGTDSSSCNTACNGYNKDTCGGDGFYAVYAEEAADVSTYAGSSSTSTSSATSTSISSASTSTSAATTAVVVTSVAPGTTIIVTHSPSTATASASSTSTSKNSSSGASTAGIAAGVVVGVLAAVALAVGAFFYLRHRKRREAEEEYKRSTQAADFARSGRNGGAAGGAAGLSSGSSEPKPPATAYSQMSDSRLDPEAGYRRNSAGSLADDQDYSRRVLRVANPDGGYS